MTQEMVRGGAASLLALVVEIVLGAWLLVLFLLALAWDPLDRRLGLHAQRHAARLQRGSVALAPAPAEAAPRNEGTFEAYGIAPASAS
jgi:hypothetical protein